MRLIDADALIKSIESDRNCSDMPSQWIDGVNYAIDLIELYEPTIDAVEVVRGEWKRKIVDSGFNADWVCSECGYRIKTDFVDYNYCPKCGAKMDGEREGE